MLQPATLSSSGCLKHVKRIKQNYSWQHQWWGQAETSVSGDIKRMTIKILKQQNIYTNCEDNEQQC
jgi:hypothetical protein